MFVVPHSDSYDPNHCRTEWPSGEDAKFGGRPVQICAYDNGKFKPHRFAFNNASPPAIEGTTAVITSEFGEGKSPFRFCRPRGRGWMMLPNQGQEHTLTWQGYEHVTNVSYSADMHDLEKDDYMLMTHSEGSHEKI